MRLGTYREGTPQEGRGVEQVVSQRVDLLRPLLPAPPSNVASISGLAASKSFAIQTLSLSAPSTRRPPEGSTGTKRATATPAFAIVISSPLATLASNRHRWVLASRILTSILPILDYFLRLSPVCHRERSQRRCTQHTHRL